MKLLAPILLLFIFASCQNEERVKPLNYVEKEIILQDNVYKKAFSKINLFIPIEFDTLLTWTDWSDCSCCELEKYRLTSSKSCLIKESGFVKIDICKDSIDRLTIEHSCPSFKNFELDTTTINNIAESLNFENSLYSDQQIIWNKKQKERINGKEFIIFDFTGQHYYAEKPTAQIIAGTKLKNTFITFRFECIQNDCSNFSTKAYQILNSVLIDTL